MSLNIDELFNILQQNLEVLSGESNDRLKRGKNLLELVKRENSTDCLINLDKSDWAEGPWKDEIDYEKWVEPNTGYTCVIGRNIPFGGIWCGYVQVPKENKFYGMSYEQLPKKILAHGGMTFGDVGTFTTCLTLECGWWLGFDCAHALDVCPLRLDKIHKNAEYRDINFVKNNCIELARQLKLFGEKEK